MTRTDDREALKSLAAWAVAAGPGSVYELTAALAREKLAALDAPEVLPDDTVCACLHETYGRQVTLWERCERCHAFMRHEDAPTLTEQAVRDALLCYIQPSVTEMIDELRDLGAFGAMSREPRQAGSAPRDTESEADVRSTTEARADVEDAHRGDLSAGAEYPTQMTATGVLAAHAAAEREVLAHIKRVRELERQIINLTKQRDQETYLRRAAQDRALKLKALRMTPAEMVTVNEAIDLAENGHDRRRLRDLLERHKEGT